MPATRALVYIDPFLDNLNPQVDGLKRAAMLFDEIVIVVAQGWRLREEISSDPTRYRRNAQGNMLPVGDFNPFQDAQPAFYLDIESWPSPIQETVVALQEAGIARQMTPEELKTLDQNNKIDWLRESFAQADHLDPEFRSLNGSTGNDQITFGRFGLARSEEHPEPSELLYVQMPPVVDDSIAITESLYYSHLTSTNAVFLRPRFRGELDYRYRQYKQGVAILNNRAPEIVASLNGNARFGEIAFNVANEVVASELISQRSLDELIRYRSELEEDRRRFISKGLLEVTELVEENAWSAQAKEDILMYIRHNLTSDIIEYNEQSREVWEKLFGSIRIRTGRLVPSMIIRGASAYTVGGFVGSVLPDISGLGALLIGLAALGKELPGLLEDVEEAIANSRKTKRSSIAYVAKLSTR